jgi:hypothetical protein
MTYSRPGSSARHTCNAIGGNDLLAHRDAAGFDTVMAPCRASRQSPDPAGAVTGGSVAEGDLDALFQLRLVTFHHEDVVALGVTDVAADLALGEERVAGDGRLFERQALEQRQRRGDRIGVRLDE